MRVTDLGDAGQQLTPSTSPSTSAHTDIGEHGWKRHHRRRKFFPQDTGAESDSEADNPGTESELIRGRKDKGHSQEGHLPLNNHPGFSFHSYQWKGVVTI